MNTISICRSPSFALPMPIDRATEAHQQRCRCASANKGGKRKLGNGWSVHPNRMSNMLPEGATCWRSGWGNKVYPSDMKNCTQCPPLIRNGIICYMPLAEGGRWKRKRLYYATGILLFLINQNSLTQISPLPVISVTQARFIQNNVVSSWHLHADTLILFYGLRWQGGDDIMEKRLLSALPLTFWNLASALLVSTDRAMPKPQSVGRVRVQIPALFLFK